MRLLEAWPAPNTGARQYRQTRARTSRTRGRRCCASTGTSTPKWRLMGRYTHDLSQTTEAGGLFFNTADPQHRHHADRRARPRGRGPAHHHHQLEHAERVLAAVLRQRDQSVYGDNVRNTRSQYGLTIPELFPENREGLIPRSRHGPLLHRREPALRQQYRNYTVADNLSYHRGDHAVQGRLAVRLRGKDELSASGTQGSFTFAAGGGRTAFQNFLSGNRDGAVRRRLHLRRARDRNRHRSSASTATSSTSRTPGSCGRTLNLDFGAALLAAAGGDGRQQRAHQLRARALSTGATRRSSTPPRHGLIAGHRRPAERHRRRRAQLAPRRGIYATEKNNIMPRVGFSWDVSGRRQDVVRGGYGIYYDQPLVGIFLQNAFVNPPFVAEPQVLNPQLSNPGGGHEPRPRGRSSASSRRAIRSRPADAAVERGRAAAALPPGRDRHRLRGLGGRQPDPARRHQPAAAARTSCAQRAALNLARPYPGLRDHQHAPDHRQGPLPRPARRLPPRRRARGHVEPRLHAEPHQDRRDQRPRRRGPSRRTRWTSRPSTRSRAPTAPTSSPPTTSTSCRSSGTASGLAKAVLGGWQVPASRSSGRARPSRAW